jgi:Phage tail tube protein
MSANGGRAITGIAKEATWGVGVAPTKLIPGTTSFEPKIDRIRTDVPDGTRFELQSDPGRKTVDGGINGTPAHPGFLGDLLRAAFGAPVSVGAAAPVVHTFTPLSAPFQVGTPLLPNVALPPYSVQSQRGGKNSRYIGGQCKMIKFNCPADKRVTVDTDWLFKDNIEALGASAPVSESSVPFRFKFVAHKRNAVAYNFIESLTISIDNGLEPEIAQDGTDVIQSVYIGGMKVRVDFGLVFRSTNIFDDFLINTNSAWVFKWSNGANQDLQFDVPNLSIDSYTDPVSSTGLLKATAKASAEFDGVLPPIKATLINTVLTY